MAVHGSHPQSGGLRAVVFQQEWIIAQHYCQAVMDGGFDIVGQARSCESAIALAVIERPDLLLMDADPHREETVLHAAQVLLASVPTCVILLTNGEDHILERAALDLGICGVFQKPIDRTTLSGRMREVYMDYCSRIPAEF